MKVTFDNVYNAFQIIAPKGTMISFTGEPTALADGVYLVGDDGIINLDEQFLTDTLYLSTEGTDYAVTGGMRVTYPLGDDTLIIRAGSSAIPFSKGGKGGGSGSGTTKYKGTTTTPISNGSTTNPIVIDGEDYTAVFGDIAVYNYTEFVFDGTTWSEFGRPFDITPTSGSANAVTSDGIYQVTPLKRGSGIGSICGLHSQNIASGEYAFAGGTSSTATGKDAFAYGYYAEATAGYAAAIGTAIKADKQNLVAVGTRNSSRTGDLFEIGNGSDSQHRSNIVEVNSTELNVNGDIKKNGVSLPTPYTTMPTITAAMLGQIAMYVGETTNDYVKGYFYIASSDGAAEPTYSWVSMVDDAPTNDSKNFVTSDGIKTALDTKQNTMQYTTMPTITASMLGKVVQYVGVSDRNYKQGWNYVAVSDSAAEPTYSWQALMDSVPTNGSNNPITSDAVFNRIPLVKGTGYYSVLGYDSNSSASGSYSLSFGRFAVASKAYAVAIGNLITSNYEMLFAIGKANSAKSGDLFEIGNGSDGGHRSNIVEVNGNRLNVNGEIKRNGVGIDDYTTTERKIGKWIDGSDLYQRTFEVTGLVNGQWNTSILGTSGINIVDAQGWIDWTYNSEPNRRLELNYYFNSDDRCSLHNAYTDLNIYPYRNESGLGIDKAVIAIKYTKTSEQANLMQTAPPEELSETLAVEEDDMR